MNRKNFYLVAAILALLTFIGFLGESGPKSLLGYSLNIWFYRIIWLAFSLSFFMNYLKMKKAEKEIEE